MYNRREIISILSSSIFFPSILKAESAIKKPDLTFEDFYREVGWIFDIRIVSNHLKTIKAPYLPPTYSYYDDIDSIDVPFYEFGSYGKLIDDCYKLLIAAASYNNDKGQNLNEFNYEMHGLTQPMISNVVRINYVNKEFDVGGKYYNFAKNILKLDVSNQMRLLLNLKNKGTIKHSFRLFVSADDKKCGIVSLDHRQAKLLI